MTAKPEIYCNKADIRNIRTLLLLLEKKVWA